MVSRILAAAVAACLGIGVATAQTQPGADPGRVTGTDSMGDKGRSGPDGWVQAPQDRTQAPGAPSPSEASGRPTGPSALPNPGAGRPMPPGEDPGTPAIPGSTERGGPTPSEQR